ncbi:unnamed protein product, partial [Effrenium voratum]
LTLDEVACRCEVKANLLQRMVWKVCRDNGVQVSRSQANAEALVGRICQHLNVAQAGGVTAYAGKVMSIANQGFPPRPYRFLFEPRADIAGFSTAGMVRRVSALHSLPVCDRNCHLDLACAYGALALQSAQRKSQQDFTHYLAEAQAMLQSAFCESVEDCTRTPQLASLFRTMCGLLHLMAEHPIMRLHSLEYFHDPQLALGRSDAEAIPFASIAEEQKAYAHYPGPEDAEECGEKHNLEPVSPHKALEIYRLMDSVAEILTHFGVQWFASHGSLLGAIRHQGLIPYDCDADLTVFSFDLHKLTSAPLQLAMLRNGLVMDFLPVQNLFTIWRQGRHGTIVHRGVGAKNNKVDAQPDLHIFVLFSFVEDRNWQYETDRIKHLALELDEDELLPLKPRFARFGESWVAVPADPEAYLDKMYGPDWRRTKRCMTGRQELKEFEPTELESDPKMALPTGPLLPVVFPELEI